MANLATPEPEDRYEPEEKSFFVLSSHRRCPPQIIEDCLRESTSLYLIDQGRLVSTGNC